MEVKTIAQNAVLDGLQKRRTTSYEPLEKIRAAETDGAFGSAGQVAKQVGFVLQRRLIKRGFIVFESRLPGVAIGRDKPGPSYYRARAAARSRTVVWLPHRDVGCKSKWQDSRALPAGQG